MHTQVWEKAGCNLAVVHGTMPVEALFAANDRLKKSDYKPGDAQPSPTRRFSAHAEAHRAAE